MNDELRERLRARLQKMYDSGVRLTPNDAIVPLERAHAIRAFRRVVAERGERLAELARKLNI